MRRLPKKESPLSELISPIAAADATSLGARFAVAFLGADPAEVDTPRGLRGWHELAYDLQFVGLLRTPARVHTKLLSAKPNAILGTYNGPELWAMNLSGKRRQDLALRWLDMEHNNERGDLEYSYSTHSNHFMFDETMKWCIVQHHDGPWISVTPKLIESSEQALAEHFKKRMLKKAKRRPPQQIRPA